MTSAPGSVHLPRIFSVLTPGTTRSALDEAFRRAIRRSTESHDASYLLWHGDQAAGHFYLHDAASNPGSQEHGLQVPELGIALADAYQGQGFGGLAVRFLEIIATGLEADGIELTTALYNENGWQTYQRAGFEYLGILRLGIQADLAHPGEQAAGSSYRDERHMLYCIHPEKKEAMLRYLALRARPQYAFASGLTRHPDRSKQGGLPR